MPDMPKFEKSSPELAARFGEVLDRVASPEIVRKPMFGYPCAWVDGNMATGLFAQSWWVRLSPERLDEVFASAEGRPLSVMPGREMKGYAALPDAAVADDAQIDGWVREALEYTATLPPKEPKARKSGAR
jgi:hypothetical protein